jgi:YaiO family outer membrane protein
MKKYVGSFIILLMSFVAATYANEIPSSDNKPVLQKPITDSSYKKLRMLYAIGRYQESFDQSIIYLKKHPDDSDVRLLLGQLYFRLKDYTKAEQELQKVLDQNPDYTDASLILIQVQLIQGRYQSALNATNFALIFNPINQDLLKKKNSINKLSLAHPPYLLGNESQLSSSQWDPNKVVGPLEYKRLDELYASGLHEDAIQQALTYLKAHPLDADARLILGKFYYNEKNYVEARAELTEVLRQHPAYVDARLMLINVEMASHHELEALNLVKTGLIINKDNQALEQKLKNINAYFAEINKKNIKKYVAKVDVTPKIAEKTYLNEVGITQQQYYISDVTQVWDYSTLFYGRETPYGKIYGKVNYTNRQGYQAAQAEIEAYPKINDSIYLDLDVAYANSPNLFPSQAYGGEAYVSLEKAFDFSIGSKYNIIDKFHNFAVYTGSIAKNFGSNWLSFRPYHFVPSVGSPSTLYSVDIRHRVRDPNYYFGCVFGTGTSPDLADLITVSFIVVKNKIISPYVRLPFFNDRLLVNLSGLYQNQIFPRNRVRNWSGGTIGFAWIF